MYSGSQQQSSSSNYKKLPNHWPGLQRSLVTPLIALASHLEVHHASIPNPKTEVQPLHVLLRL